MSKSEKAISIHKSHPLFDVLKVQDQDATFEEDFDGVLESTLSKDIDIYGNIFNDHRLSAISRSAAEQDSNYKQIIPYTLIGTIKDGELWLLLYQRRKTDETGEVRLVDKVSFGFGGHMTLEDYFHADIGGATGKITYLSPEDTTDAIINNIQRELSEEIGFIPPTETLIYYHSEEEKVIDTFKVVVDDWKTQLENTKIAYIATGMEESEGIASTGIYHFNLKMEDVPEGVRFIDPSESLIWDTVSSEYFPFLYQHSGWLYDNTNLVGRVHVGLLGLMILKPDVFDRLIENDDTEGQIQLMGAVTLNDAMQLVEDIENDEADGLDMENWSKSAIWYLNKTWIHHVKEGESEEE